MKKFWNWMKNEDTGATELYFEGPISAETWLGDEITPGLFKSELEQHPGDLTVWICSPGGDVFAASQIYTMLRNHKELLKPFPSIRVGQSGWRLMKGVYDIRWNI